MMPAKVALINAVILAVMGCQPDRIEIRAEVANDYHREEVRLAVDAYVAAGRTAMAYGVMATKFAALRPSMDATVAADAELRLVTLALAPMLASVNLTPERELKELTTTVWPVGLQGRLRADTLRERGIGRDEKLVPLAYEPGGTYLTRICGDALKADCYGVVPEYQLDVLRRLVVQRFTERVRSAVADCVLCADDPSWRDYVRQWEALDSTLTVRSRRAERKGDPALWPVAGRASEPMPDESALIAFDVNALGELSNGDLRIAKVDRVAKLRELVGQRQIMLHAPPSARLSEIRSIVGDMIRAGAKKIGLVARRTVYPWEPRVYWVTMGVAGRKIPVSAGDTMQVVISALDEMPPAGALARID
jgi:hypothetical protein